MLPESILKQLTDLARVEGATLHLGVYYKNTLVALCHALEDAIAQSQGRPVVLAAFQLGKWYLQEADRYGQLADRSRQIVILAAPDAGFTEHSTSQRSNVAIVPLSPTDPVAQEWHLTIVSPSYCAMVLCQELTAADYGPEGPPQSDLERKFYGLWTFVPQWVDRGAALLVERVARYQPALAEQLQRQLAAVAQAQATAPGEDWLTITQQVVNYLQATHQHRHPELQPGQLGFAVGAPLDQNLVSNELQAFLRLAELLELSDGQSSGSAAAVAALTEAIGQLLDLPAAQLKRMRLAAALHRLGRWPTVWREGLADPSADCCDLSAVQVLRVMPRLRPIAHILNHLTEHWDGSGQPSGLAGDAIPLESRVVALCADFQHRRSRGEQPDEILQHYRDQSGRWDPKLLEALTLLAQGLQQGWELPQMSLRASSGLWLLDEGAIA
ncbi:MAG: DICT sensory domain-containing protein [Limnothrix sp. BL-A-16]